MVACCHQRYVSRRYCASDRVFAFAVRCYMGVVLVGGDGEGGRSGQTETAVKGGIL